MRGFPSHLNTKRDYMNCLAVMPHETAAALQGLLEARYAWFPARKLNDGEEPALTDGQKVVLSDMGTPGGEASAPERWLYEWREDKNASLFRLGFTVAEVKKLIKTVGE